MIKIINMHLVWNASEMNTMKDYQYLYLNVTLSC